MDKLRIFTLLFAFNISCLSLYAQENKQPQNIVINEPSDDIFYHTVERGQTVYAIATMYGVGVQDIYRLNPGSEQGIKAGAVLKIPQRDVAVAPIETPGGDEEGYTYHTIQAKETLYSLAIKYKVQDTEIVRANPGLSVETFQIGKIIRIPATRIEHIPTTEVKTVTKMMDYTIERRETIYRISRKFNISSAELIRLNPKLKDGLKTGMVIKVPVEAEEVVTEQAIIPQERDVNELLKPKQIERVDRIQVALLLPFTTQKASYAVPLYVEYYEGMLMAVDSLRNGGYSMDLSVYDTGDGTKMVTEILQKEELKKANLIIGAVQNDQITPVANFAKEHNIKYVIPFTSSNDDVLSNASVFQVNTPHSYLYSKAAQAGCDLFARDNIIIVRFADEKEKPEYIQVFKGELEQRGLTHKEITYVGESFVADIEKVLDPQRRNIVLPTSSSWEALNCLRSPLRMLTETNPDRTSTYMINLFGYPEWQTYTATTTSTVLEDLYALNTYIYTHFYANNLSADVQHFHSRYKDWYSKTLINTFPKYGILGFDTAMYFFSALKQYGANFEDNLNKVRYKSLQTGFNFERVNNWGGFINTNVFIVQYRNDFTVVRNEIK